MSNLIFFSDRLQEEQEILEEQCEKRIELLTKSMKKSRKRKKIDRIETEDDSYVSSVLLHAEKVKVKVRNEFQFVQLLHVFIKCCKWSLV